MKRLVIWLMIAMFFTITLGCSLFPNYQKNIYFYEMAGEGNQPSSYRLSQRNDGHIIIMSRGVENRTLSRDEAEDLIPDTGFTLQLEEQDLVAAGPKDVDELGNTGWHVVQSFTLDPLEKGTYVLTGTSTFYDMEDNSQRRNEVTLEIF